MYETQTYEAIMQRLLDRIPDTLDKREGSFIWDALSPAAIELAQAYINLDLALAQTFAGSASDDKLDQRVAEMGVIRLPASPAKGTVEFTGVEGTVIPAGTLVMTPNGIQYLTDNTVTIDSLGKASASITAVQGGKNGNVSAEVITILSEPISGVTSVSNPEATYGGEDEETDEALRIRYFQNIVDRAIDGNIAQYKKWASEFLGIGRVKVFPLWNGPNTVKVSILDSENQVASAGLIADFQEYLDPNSEGLGNGVAPIGAIVTVTTATAVDINVSADIVLAEGYTEPTGIDEALIAYFKELAYVKSNITYIGIGAAILAVPSVDQVQNLVVNGGTADISLTAEQIPRLGTTTWTVVT